MEGTLLILNLESKATSVVVRQEHYFFDMAKVPSQDDQIPYFILHTGGGLQLLDTRKGRLFNLADNAQDNFDVCRSISIQSIEQSGE